MKHFNYFFNLFRDWFIGERLSETSDAIKKIKLKIAFNVYVLFAIISFLYIPYLLSPELSKQLKIAIVSLCINAGLLLLLKFRDLLKASVFIHLASMFVLITFQMYYSQGNVSFVTVSWLFFASIFGFFLLGRRVGFIVVFISFLIISTFIYLKFNNYNFPEYSLNEQTYYLGIFISLSLVFAFTYMMVDNFTKYNSELLKNLFETEIRLSTILENLPTGAVYIYNNRLYLNKEFSRVFGYTSEEINNIENLEEKLFFDLFRNDKTIFQNTFNNKNSTSHIVLNTLTKNKEVKSVEVTMHFGNEYEIILFKDITALHSKEKELAESIFFLESLSSAIPHIIFLFDLEKGVNTYVNPSINNILNYSNDELKTKNIFDLLHPDDIERVKKHIKLFSTLKDDETGEIEYRLKNKQGKYIWMRSIHKIFKRNSNGIPKVAVGIAEDITEKKLAEIQYKDINERLSLATSAVNFGVWEWDLATNTFYWDDSMYSLFETTRKQFPNPVDAFQERVHPEDYEFAWIGIEEAYKPQEKFENTFRIVLPDNTTKYLRAAYKFFKDIDGNPIKAIGINYDVSDDKRREVLHKNNNVLLTAINTNSNKLFYEKNFSNSIHNLLKDIGTNTFVDEIFICNYNNENNSDLAINYNWSINDNSNSENESFKSCLKSKMLSNLEPLKKGSIFKIDNADNNDYELTSLKVKSVLIIPVFVEGNFWGVIVMKSNNHNKFWEQYNDIIFSNFANTIGTAIAQNRYKEDLKAQKEKAEEVLKIKSDFFATVSHEIRTPLNAINGLTNLIEDEAVSAALKQKINLLKYSVENLNFIVNDILNFNKAESPAEPVIKESFSFKEFCNEIINHNTYWAERKRIKMLLELDSNIPHTVIGDKVKLKQVLNNLLANSIKNTEQGYVKLTANFLKQTKLNTEISFTIEDTSVSSINELYSSPSLKGETVDYEKNFSIKNINLPITIKIIDSLGGKILNHKSSTSGSSISFTLFFENHNKNVPIANNVNSIIKYNFSGKKFLLVEDNEINALIASKFLTSWGAEIKAVTNGKEAIDVLTNENFDMVLLDIFMPELDGYSTAKKIRAFSDSKKANIPIIVITASTSEEIHQTIAESGINDFITKPFQPKELSEKINKYLG